MRSFMMASVQAVAERFSMEGEVTVVKIVVVGIKQLKEAILQLSGGNNGRPEKPQTASACGWKV